MSVWADIKQRRITQIVLSYLVGGWILLQVVDQMVDREVLPRYVYLVALILFAFGIPAALIIGWYHGEKGDQRAKPLEVGLLTILAIGAIGSSVVVVRGALRIQAAQAGEVPLDRLAVLYFTGTDEETSLVAGGITEDLIDRLSQVQGLSVVSRNGARSVRDEAMTAEEAAAYLEVGTVLEGDVRRAGDQFVVSAQMRTWDGIRLASITAREDADDLTALQDQVARRLEDEIRATVGEEIRLRESRSAAPNNGAWLAVARGERALAQALDQASGGLEAMEPELAAAEEAFREASELAPDWVEPWNRLAEVAFERARRSPRDPEAADSLSQAAVALTQAALDRQPTNREAVFWRGNALYVRYLYGLDESDAQAQANLDQAQSDLERAAEGGIAEAYATLSHLFYQVEDPYAAALAARQAYEADRYLAATNAVLERLFLTNYDLEDPAQSRRWCEEGYRRFPDDYFFTECKLFLMTMSGERPEIDRAWALLDSIRELAGPRRWESLEAMETLVVGGVIARAGLPDSASAVMDRVPGEPSVEAAMRILNGEREQAIQLLREYTAATGGHFGQGTGLMWWWRPLQGDPEFERLRRLN